MRRFVNLPPGARSRRCDRHDYRGGAYFVTTNTKNRAPRFGTVERGRMYLNHYGRIVAEEWKRTGELRDAVSLELPPGLQKCRAGTLSTIVGCFKAAVPRRINEKRDAPGETIWQSNFRDRIVRNRKELRRVRHYIRKNPQEWVRSD